jgi:hypothetical protein
MTDKKPLINMKIEQSRILEEIERLKQFVLASSLRQDRILKLDSQIENIMFNVYSYYEDAITAQTEVGNI